MARVVTFTNMKGGVGKTTSAVAFASILQKKGKKVLFIDGDKQCNSTDTYRAQIEDTYTLYDLILSRRPCSLNEAIQTTEFGDIIASDPQMDQADETLNGKADGMYRIKAALEDIEDYDFVVIDTNPSMISLLNNALVASDDVILPITPGRYSTQGFAKLTEDIYSVQKYHNRSLHLSGILLVKYAKNKTFHRNARMDLEAIAEQIGTKVFDTTIRECIKTEEAQSNRMPLIVYAPKCTTEIDYEAFVDEYLSDLEER